MSTNIGSFPTTGGSKDYPPTSAQDPLARASAVPQVSALIQEFQQNMRYNAACSISNVAAAESIRLNRWAGKSNPPDGCRWQRNGRDGKPVFPYDGRPDTDVNLCDEVIQGIVDIFLAAWKMGQIGAATTHISPLSASQVAELVAVAEWVRKVTDGDLVDDKELLAQMTATLGWSVLNPGWVEKWELVQRNVDMEDLGVAAQQSPPGTLASMLPQMLLDPTMEKTAIETFESLYPHMATAEARRVVRELRNTGHTTFMDKQLVEKRPTLRTLIQGYNYFILGSTFSIAKARGHLVMERFYQADLEATGAAAGWNEDFVKRAIATQGHYSQMGDLMRQKAATASLDSADRSIEIWTTFIKQYDEETGASGIYCTTFSPHLQPAGGEADDKSSYASHYLLDYAHGRAPFVQTRLEVIGPSLDDSRGVSEMVQSDMKVIKNLQDALVARAHLEVNPPRALIGAGWTKKTHEVNSPGALIETMMPGATVADLGPSRGNPQMGELAIERVEKGTHRRFALPNTMDGSHPAAWQTRQMRLTARQTAAVADAYTQLVILCYQNFDEEELAQIIGRWPQMTVEDVLKHRVTLTFDPRGLDDDWRKQTLATMVQLLSIDKGGTLDSNVIISIIGSFTDPTLMQSAMRSQAGASAALYRKVQNDINDIMLGNPPPLVEMDATAGMQLQYAFQVIGKNPRYQQMIANDPQVKENLKVYIQNLQHSVQETQLSPQQGRLGVADSPQRPVQTGAPQVGEQAP